MQDAFLKLWERWDQIGEIDDAVGYLFRVALNGFRMRARRARVRSSARPSGLAAPRTRARTPALSPASATVIRPSAVLLSHRQHRTCPRNGGRSKYVAGPASFARVLARGEQRNEKCR